MFFKHSPSCCISPLLEVYSRDVKANSESILLFEEPEAKAFFIKHGAGMWKRLILRESGSTLKKEAGSRSKLGSD